MSKVVKSEDCIELDYSNYKPLSTKNQVEKVTIRSPKDIQDALKYIANEEQEHFVVIGLTAANTIIFNKVITIGLVNSSQIHPREVFKELIRHNCVGAIISHNHPSGSLKASKQDIEITNTLVKSGELLGINILDHIIISSEGFASLKGEGYM